MGGLQCGGKGLQYGPFLVMLLIAQLIERLVVAQEVTSLSLVEEPRFSAVFRYLTTRESIPESAG